MMSDLLAQALMAHADTTKHTAATAIETVEAAQNYADMLAFVERKVGGNG
jgi:hypothetical protein